MNIALVSRFTWPRVGGTEALVRELAGQYVRAHEDVLCFAHRIDQDGIDWLGALDRGPALTPISDPVSGVRTIQLRLSRRDASILKAVERACGTRRSFEALHAAIAGRAFAEQSAGTEIVHRFGGNRMALAVIRAARKLGVPAVITPLAHPGQWDDDAVSARAYRESAAVIATSRADAETYERLGVAPEKLHVCSLPTRAGRTGGGVQLRARLGIDGPIVLFLGERRAYKGFDQLLGAGRRLARRLPELRLVFVGPGAAISDQPGVIDVGQVPDDERDAWIDAADLVCLPSSAESFGLVISEAWSVATPVVTSDIPVFRERVSEAEGGLAVPAHPQALADAIYELLVDETLRRRMGESGQAYWRTHCSPESVAAWHRSLYRQLSY